MRSDMAMSTYVMEMVHGFETKTQSGKQKNLHVNGLIGLREDTHFVIVKLPHSCVLKFLAKVVFLAFVVVSLSWLGLIEDISSTNFRHGGVRGIHQFTIDPMNVKILPLLFRDLTNEGLLRIGDRVLIVTNGADEELAIYYSQILHDNKIDLIHRSNLERMSVPDETYDFVFVHGSHADVEFADRVLKPGSVAVVQLSDNCRKASFQKPSNYNIVYLRQFEFESDSTIMAMRKPSHVVINEEISTNYVAANRRLLGFASSEAKKAALNKLENVLLEPPRAASGKSKTYLKKTRYLPDLMGDSLESYPRRVFINVGGNVGWFAKNYPRKNKDFEIYEIEPVAVETSAVSGGSKEGAPAAQVEMTEWLRKNVKEEEYVVMKAEAEVVEDIVRRKAIGLVDELFLECKHQGIKTDNGKRSRRPYWECLALYGTLRDEGVAVHQWWG